jgi:hypothetical protein
MLVDHLITALLRACNLRVPFLVAIAPIYNITLPPRTLAPQCGFESLHYHNIRQALAPIALDAGICFKNDSMLILKLKGPDV